MEDQQGNVIDGTARARQWRGSKPKGRPAPESAETRSDAPKSFAGSLLVPAEMLSSTLGVGERSNGSGHRLDPGRGRAIPPGAQPNWPVAHA
jgi:hypothetical protein